MSGYTKEKQSNIQLLRILIILMVIVLHYNYADIGGAFKFATLRSNMLILKLFESFSICAVNVFVIISGYFLIDRNTQKITKVIGLFGWVIFYQMFFCIVEMYVGKSFQLREIIAKLFPINYYVYLYVTLYLISPFLNQLVAAMDIQKYRKMLVIFLLLFSVHPTVIDTVTEAFNVNYTGVSTISLSGSQQGYSIVNFVLLYYIGGYLKKTVCTTKKKQNALLWGGVYAGLSVLIWVYSLFFASAWTYCNLLVIAQACSLFIAFININIKNNCLINFLAESVFGVYLIHGQFMKKIAVWTNVSTKVSGGGQ